MAQNEEIVPFWTIAPGASGDPSLTGGQELSEARLRALRLGLSASFEGSTATLEAHAMPTGVDTRNGRLLPASNPLAAALSGVADAAEKVSASKALRSGETLYRMVVDPKVAQQLGEGLVQPMASKAVAGGIRSAIRDSTGIVSQASFVPAAEAGAAITAAAIAGPLLVMGVAVGATVYAEHQQQQQLKRIEELLTEQKEDRFREERYSLEASRAALQRAAMILLDEGKVGVSVGIGNADHEIDKAIARTRHRANAWQAALDRYPENEVREDELKRDFPGIEKSDGEFHQLLALSQLAISLRRRLGIVQALEHVQLNSEQPMDRFLAALAKEQSDIEQLDSRLSSVAQRLSSLSLRSPGRLIDRLMTRGEVDGILATSDRLRRLAPDDRGNGANSVVIEMARHADGSVTVLPAFAVSE